MWLFINFSFEKIKRLNKRLIVTSLLYHKNKKRNTFLEKISKGKKREQKNVENVEKNAFFDGFLSWFVV
jgi:hypothetical protein